MFIENKYKKIYDAIILSASKRIVDTSIYTEQHHIIPRSLGGSDMTTNIVTLSSREHFICHILLTKFTTGAGRHKMLYAACILSKAKRSYQNRYFNSRLYENIKTEAAKVMSVSRRGKTYEELYGEDKAKEMRLLKSLPRGAQKIETIQKRAEKLLGKKRTDEQCKTMSEAQKNRLPYVYSDAEKETISNKISLALADKRKTEEHKKHLSAALIGKTKGITKSEETKQKMRKPKTPEHRKAISDARKAKYAALRQTNP
jgi:hypothetical protein